MFTQAQREAIAQHLADALIEIIDELPERVHTSEPEAAARLTADLVKLVFADQAAQPAKSEAAKSLDDIMREAVATVIQEDGLDREALIELLEPDEDPNNPNNGNGGAQVREPLRM